MLPGPNEPAATLKVPPPFGTAPIRKDPAMRLFAKALLASTLAAGATFAVAPVHAESTGVRSVAVRYADLDLKSQAGKDTLQRRIAFAAGTVCGPADTLSYHSRQSVASCEARAIANAGRATVDVIAAAESTLRVAAN